MNLIRILIFIVALFAMAMIACTGTRKDDPDHRSAPASRPLPVSNEETPQLRQGARFWFGVLKATVSWVIKELSAGF